MEKLKNKNGKWDLEKIARVCERELRRISIPLDYYIRVHIIRSNYVFGMVKNGDLYISNTYRSTEYELTEVKTVISHLLLHTVDDCVKNHGEKWMKYAKRADEKYGLHIIEHAASRPEAGRNWYSGSAPKTAESKVKQCCFLDYEEKLAEVVRECSKELNSVGIQTGRITYLAFSDADMVYTMNGRQDCRITVSDKFIKEEADIFCLKSVICRLLLYTYIENISSGQPRWREMARKVENEYGYKILGWSYPNTVRQTSDISEIRYVCPVCGGYYDVYKDADKLPENDVYCNWCDHKMLAVKEDERGILDAICIMMGEMQDELRLAGIPVGVITGIGFVLADRPAGLHDNWNKTFSIDLPAVYKHQGIINDAEFKAWLCRELLRTCEGCKHHEAKWEEYLQKAEMTLGFPIQSQTNKEV